MPDTTQTTRVHDAARPQEPTASEHTGGHHFDTGDGPQPLTGEAVNAQANDAQGAYREYLSHRPGCAQCRQSTFICDTAKTLWDAYTQARRHAP